MNEHLPANGRDPPNGARPPGTMTPHERTEEP